MIWIGTYIVKGLRRKFRIEFNAYKNEWVEFPDWLRESLQSYIDGNPQPFDSVVIPSFLVAPTLDPLPLIELEPEDEGEDPEFVTGVNSLHILYEVMWWLQDNNVIKINAPNGIEQTYVMPDQGIEPPILDGWMN